MKTPKERKLEKQMMLQESRKDMIERLNKKDQDE